ncbi:MAG: class II aldolase/adducin family protein [Myxococcales bacterium]|nr:class II aldolase/adducin family protein [Myxococcales bacterium]
MEREGVIQFSALHQGRTLAGVRHGHLAEQLGAWRRIFVQTGLVGARPERYEGLGFGNLSGRTMPPSQPKGRRGFLITCSQTGEHEALELLHYALVSSYSLRRNQVCSEGQCMPSSESLTHGAFYDLTPAIRFVFHVHAPAIWENASELRLPTSDAGVSYGTAEMGWEVQRLYRTSSLSETRVMAMGGHTDGVIGVGRTAQEAGLAIMAVLARAYETIS